jgi:hypothetical protein
VADHRAVALSKGAAHAGSGIGTALEVLGRIVAPVTLVTAMLYYFGYIRAQTLYMYFGVDLGSLGFSTTDYLIRSANVAFLPLATILVAALVTVALHHLLALALPSASDRWVKGLTVAMAACGVLLLVLAVIGLRRVTAFGSPLIPPVALGCGALLVGYSAFLVQDRLALSMHLRKVLDDTRSFSLSVLVAIVLVAAFWAIANFAAEQGTLAARALESSLPVQPQAVVYSVERLHISGPGVVLTALDKQDATYRYRYTGLRLLIHTNNRWFLVPAGWTRTNGSTVVILLDTPDRIRVDLAP